VILSVPVTVTDPAAGKSATASVSSSVRVAFGTNLAEYATVSPALPGITFTKAFSEPATGTNGVPPKWPGDSASKPPAGTRTLSCFCPDPAMLLAGELDTPVKTYFGLAGPDDVATAYQEGNGSWSPVWATAGFTVADWRAMHVRLAGLAADASPGLRYGQVLATSPVRGGQDITPYVVPGMGWYSMDGYDLSGTSTPEAVFGETWAGILTVEPAARCAITETNSADTTGEWFTGCWEWLTANGGVLFSSFWETATSGGQHYPWPPSDAVLATLQDISEQCAA